VGDPPPPEPAQPEPGQQAEPAPAPAGLAGAGAGPPARGGGAADKSGISGALIGAGGAVVAALIGGIFLVIVTGHHGGGGGGGPTAQASTPAPQASGPVQIRTVSWSRPVNGVQAVSLKGTEQGLTIGEVIFAVAGRNKNTQPFYSSAPVRPSSTGIWSASIQAIPASVRSLTFWPSVASSPLSSTCPFACAAAVYVKDRQKIAVAGPHAAFLTHVGPPVQSHAPSG
jgi:hypothetical protein